MVSSKRKMMRMKYPITRLIALGAVLLAAFGCRTTRESDPGRTKAEKMYSVHFETGEIPATKTVFTDPETVDGVTEYPVRWTANDGKIAASLNFGGAKGATVVPSEDFTSATFDAEFPQSEVEAPYVFYALSPFSASVGATSSHGGYHLNIPTDQTPLASSCDEAAQLLIASKEVSDIADFSHILLQFNHVTAYGKLTLKNMTKIPEGATILSVELTASEPFAGRFYYNFEEDALSESASSRTITLKPDNLTFSGGNCADIWFACAPADLGGGTIKVDVNTSMGVLSRTVEIPAGKLAFNAGRISKFSVNMAEAEFTQSADRWVLVTNASMLAAGDEIIIANSATPGSAYAISTTQNSNNRGRVAVSITTDTDGSIVIQNPSVSVEVLALEAGNYNGFFRLKEATSQTGRYLYTRNDTNNSNYNYLMSSLNPTTQGYANWKITINSSNNAIIAAYQSYTKSGKTYYKQIRYNTASNSYVFAAYRSTSQTSWSNTVSGTNAVFIYRKEAGVNLDDDPILEQTEYGAYLTTGNNLYGTGAQLSREYINDGTVTFAILKPSVYQVVEFNNIPVSPAKGDTFTLNYNVITGRNAADMDYNVTVLKVDGPKVWLSAGGGNGFIVKK